MNKTIKLAVAGAVFAAASVANAGIIIPAGEWTLDVNGNVNAFANYTHARSGQAGSGSVAVDSSFGEGDLISDSQYNNAAAITGGLAWGGAAAGTYITFEGNFVTIYLALFSGFVIYVATSHILPEAHSHHPSRWTFAATGAGVLAEILGTALLVAVIFGVAVDKRSVAASHPGLPIGLTITAIILSVGPITGAALNPARWFGPALVSGDWTNAWIYVVAPVIGALFAGLAYQTVAKPE